VKDRDLQARLVLALLIAVITWVSFRSQSFWEVAAAVAVLIIIVLLVTVPTDPNGPLSMF
jgi:hypothetical protein